MTRIARGGSLFVILLFLLLLAGVRDRLWAHAILLESSPADGALLSEAPSHASLRFSSKLETLLCRVTLISADGHQTVLQVEPSQPDASPGQLHIRLPRLPPGAYILRFTVLATDGHATEGVVRFRIATPR